MKKETLETERLILRPWQESDAADMFEYAKDPDVGPNAGWPPHKSVEESIERSKRWAENWEKESSNIDLEFALTLKESGKVIGSLGLDNDGWRTKAPNSWSMGYVLGKAYWGRGLMTEAVNAAIDYVFGSLGAKLLCINHYPDNPRSRRVIEKSGFTYEGTLRQAAVLFDGTVKSLCCYSMTAAEYWLLQAKKRGLSLALPEELSPGVLAPYWEEWGDSRMAPSASDRKGRTEQEWLEYLIASRTHTRPELVTFTLYFLIDREGKPIGSLDLRHGLNDGLRKTGGNIGYGVRPSCRGKGYAPCMLALALEKAKERGMEKILVTCVEENKASAATIEDCGGILENKVEADGKTYRRYWIAL